jgi:glycosyltransferase involved in cell wall biosynthesis
MVGKSRTRVAFCIDDFAVGGSQLNALRTAEALDPNRFELRVFCLQKYGPLFSRYEALSVPMTHLPIPNLYSPGTITQGLRLARELRAWRAQVLHAHDVYTNIFSAPWARMLGSCGVIASRRWWHWSPRPGLPWANRLSYRFANRVLANSESVAAMLVAEERVPKRKIVVIPNFLEDQAFECCPDGDVLAMRSAWEIPPQAFVIATVARLHPVKNHAMLLRALALLSEDCHLLLIGDGPSRAELELLSRELGIAPRVHFAGELVMQTNPHSYADVSVLCSHSEGFPNSVVEAMAASRAVVATPVGGIVDVIEHQRTGLLTPVDDAPALAAALRRLRDDKPLRARLGAAGLALVRARHQRARVIDGLSELYEQLASR